ncbi:putative Ig domain-containing protein [Bradyrhizobium elkanii]|uniref:GLUG motif-containing protein n=1 Tax=Bradyrhizobium elkanii TaxID=29448 RepID=UPI0027120952|nr:GLUG motif-containing protein [Bradyrhizobium elkanii]WLA39706.1 putative Ig domain-containing protein [Bradyrhizobium elkanii]
MPAIYIEMKAADNIELLIDHHLYLVYRADDGREWVLRAGPSSISGVFGGPFDFEINDRLEDSGDARIAFDLIPLTPEDRDSTLLVFPRSADDTWNLMCNYARDLQASGVSYSLDGLNSNTFIAALIAAAGRDPIASLPPGVLPFEVLGYSHYTQMIQLVTPPADATIRIQGTYVGIQTAETIYGSDGPDSLDGAGGNDRLDGGPGRDICIGGSGGDAFVFDAAALADARATTPLIDRIKDYNQGNSGVVDSTEGDFVDLSQLLSSAYGSGQAVSSLVRVVEDPTGGSARLQVDPNGAVGGANWVSIAQLDGIHQGDTIQVILDPFHSSVPVRSNLIVINTLADLEAVRNNLSGHYVLGADFDATGIPFPSIGSSSNPFTGTFDGNGHTINGLHVVGNGIYVGLFAEVGAGGKISNLGLANLSVSAPRGYDVGGLAGRNVGTIENSYTTGTVTGTAGNFVAGLNGVAIGGVAGWNFGTIKNSYSSATITSDSTIFVDLGGLAGGNSGTIDHSHANGLVIGHSGAYGTGLVEIGGLVGSLGDFNGRSGIILNSYATGSVVSTGSNSAAGGLVGESVNNSTIFQSYATGAVSAGGPSWDGGLVGILFNGTISQSFAKGSVTVGNGGDAGGLVGQMNSGTIFESYAKGPATGGTGSDVGGLVAHSYGGTISQSYATGKVTAGSLAITGGLVAENSAFTSTSYWDYQSTGQLKSSGGIPEPTFFLTLGTLPVGFDPAVWAENVGRYPYLKWQPASKAMDGYISGATIFADDNDNGILDLDEIFTVTDEEGNFDPIGGIGPLKAYGGIDTTTGLPFKGLLTAPVGSTVITPLTTLISSLQSQGDSVAEQKVLAAFGLSPGLDLTTFDPIAAVQAGDIAGAEVAVAVAKVYNTVSLIASALVGAGGTFVTGANDAFAAIAAAIGGSGISLTDNAAPSALISNIAQSESLSLGQGVADKVASLIAANNAALDEKATADGSSNALLNDIAAIERVFQGSVSNAIQQSADDPSQLQVIVDAFSGAELTSAIATALSHLGNNQDLDPPTLTPVADQTIEATSATGAVASFSATATDVVDGNDPLVFKEGNTVVHSGDVFGLGTHTITAKAVDAAGNLASESFIVKVVDTTAPTLTPVGDQTVHATGLTGAQVIFSATASDLVDGNDPVVFKEDNTAVHSSDVFALGVHTITASATDAAGNTAFETFTIKVADEAPSVSPLARSLDEDGPIFSQDLLIGANDPDISDLLSVSGFDLSVTSAGGRKLVLGTDYTLTNSTLSLTAVGFAKFNGLAPMQTDNAVFQYSVSDGILTTANVLTLNVVGSNDAPALVNQTQGQSLNVGTPFSLTLPANTFQDADSGDHLTLAATLANGTALPSWLTFNAATGIFSGTPGPSNAGGLDIKVTATDTSGSAASDIFHMTVINHAPIITSDGAEGAASIIITDDTKYVDTVRATDPDPNTTIKYSIVGGQDQKLFTMDAKSGALSFKSMPQDGRSYQVQVAASDGALQDTQTIKVQVARGAFEFGNANVADTFVFKSGFGLAIVSNFDATSSNHDMLELDHALFRQADIHASPGSSFDVIQHHSFQLGSDVIILTDTRDVIDLRSTNLHSLTAMDFILV